jgi:hypothetical protein
MDSLRSLLAQLQSASVRDRNQMAGLPAPSATPDTRGGFSDPRPEGSSPRRRDFGRFYALIIGVQNYDLLDDLETPLNDVERIAGVLEQHYGFRVFRLPNPDQLRLMRTVNDLNEEIGENDNLLIYFAGHGSRLRSGALETGYWLPTNAEPAPNDTLWVSNESITRHLGRLQAKRILVISDASYAGLLGDEPGYVLIGERRYSPEYLQWKLPKRSRLVLVSGEDRPVVDRRQGSNSLFARALLDVLERNDGVLTAPELFLNVRDRVRQLPLADGSLLSPALKFIKEAGHEVGDFFLVSD